MLGYLGRAILVPLTLCTAILAATGAAVTLLPPFNEVGWRVRLVLTEWSLLLVLIALLALVLAAAAWWAGARRTGFLAGLLALLTVVAAGIQPVRAVLSAAEHNVRLDPVEYLAGPSFGSSYLPDATMRYATAGGRPLRLDVWEPQADAGSRPAVVLVHGGRWADGARSEQPQWNRWLTEQGFVVFSIDYRLAKPGRQTWREAPGDVKCAVSWVRSNAQSFDVDPERLVLMGSSAGGHLALLAAYAGAELPSSCPHQDATDTSPDGPAEVSRVITLYAPTTLRPGFDAVRPWWYSRPLWEAGLDSIRAYTGGAPETHSRAYAVSEPLGHVRPGLPPTLLIHGTNDLIVPVAEARRMASALRQAGGPHRYVEVGYADHLFDVSWGGFGTQIARSKIADFLTTSNDTP